MIETLDYTNLLRDVILNVFLIEKPFRHMNTFL